MRNKITLAMAVFGMMSTVPAFATPIATTDAGQGTIQFTGSVIDAPCSIVPESQNIQVNLGQVNLKTLDQQGKTSSSVPFSINLTGCSFDAPGAGSTTVLYSKVAVAFPGVNSPTGGANQGEISNGATTGAATNVAIQLLQGDGTSPVNFTPSIDDAIQLDSTSATSKLQFYARMMATGVATAGNVGATVTYKLHYF
ncbi:fimbrial protein [Salmonella enterica]|uniref:fimbrial protein n=1 Tax=Salmonella enterica TaxID=28901 RepID=UPI0003BCF3FA|nr:long polar fimbrial protein LpfA [Salmonella enterica]EBV8519982.1 long polar fimbrial protein LpfA [Salmonella enterica subsp. enterica serovar Larochelle]ECN0437775.1 fimbrial protein [Salmonella enterica subsp. enterica serovar Newport]ECV0008729.1 long polar fimbrial protein LpfA [Salmonella enterica subsp. enterica serovar Saintpaul]EDQ6762882.1 fimbrial protein [Salmonella enterica subsp. enterica serovar Oranienburg]EDS1172010.1 fimbrial protein [Salmonella enterica subsp. enterica s